MREAQQFREVFGLPNGAFDSAAIARLNIEEEFKEFQEAFEGWLGVLLGQDKKESEHLLKEMGDLVYTVFQLAAERQWNLDEALKRIHQSNLSKLGENGRPMLNEYGKVMKGPKYMPPDLSNLV